MFRTLCTLRVTFFIRFDSFVCSLMAGIPTSCRHFCSYPGPRNEAPECKIWEAARATSAAPTFFKPIKIIDSSGLACDYVDGGLGFNNPAQEVISQAKLLFGDRSIGVVVSIGTGVQDIRELQRPQGINKIFPIKNVKAMLGILTDVDTVHKKMAEEYRDGDRYSRFNVTAEGIKRISLDDWKKMQKVKDDTDKYVTELDVSSQISRVVSCLCSLSTTASLPSLVQIHPGKTIPPLKVKETSPEHAETVQLSGTTIIVRAVSSIVLHVLNLVAGRRPGSVYWIMQHPNPRIYQ